MSIYLVFKFYGARVHFRKMRRKRETKEKEINNKGEENKGRREEKLK